MDEPYHPTVYDMQLLQVEEGNKLTLRDAFDEMKPSGSKVKLVRYISGVIHSQMSAKAGIRKCGQVAIDALFAKFLQLHERGVFKGNKAKKLSKEQRQEALCIINVIKEKHCRKMKGRSVALGQGILQMH